MSLTIMSTFVWSPLDAVAMISSKSLIPVSKLLRPMSVPPPIIVPETRSNESNALTLIMLTPLPILTRIEDF